jgi:2-oxoglutarate ferredoxin oxidoreductase subunit alpha
VVVRFAGDSGDGVQLTGTQFTKTSAMIGNDIATLPDFPAEIRAPAGTLFGVSGFQIQFGSTEIRTPGDVPDALIAFNPAALKTNVERLKRGGLLLVNTDSFTSRNIAKAGYETNPLEDDSLAAWQLVKVDMTRLTREALKETSLRTKDKDRAKNLFALGMVYFLYDRPSNTPSPGCAASLRASPRSPRPTSKHSRRATTTQRQPRSSTVGSRFRKRSSLPASTAT